MCMSVCLSVSVSLSVCIYLWVYVSPVSKYRAVFISVGVFVCLSLYSLCGYQYMSLGVCRSLCVDVYVYLCVCVGRYLCLFLCVNM